MAFTGKATYSSGINLPEIAEDVSDLIGIISPFETPLLNALGDPMREAHSTCHEWLEDSLMPNKDAIDDSDFTDPDVDTQFNVENGNRFKIGDQIQIEGSRELMLVTAIATNTLTVVRGYAGTTAEDLTDDAIINILGNAALEGGDKPLARFGNRIRCSNYTQIFTAAVEISGSDMAATQLGLADEMDYQKQERLRELLRDLENTVINGGLTATNPQGSDSSRRTMKGMIQHLGTNVFTVGDSGFATSKFGLDGFGWDANAAAGFGKGVMGAGFFGIDANIIQWTSNRLKPGQYKLAIVIIDEAENQIGCLETEPITVIPSATPASDISIAQNTAMLQIT